MIWVFVGWDYCCFLVLDYECLFGLVLSLVGSVMVGRCGCSVVVCCYVCLMICCGFSCGNIVCAFVLIPAVGLSLHRCYTDLMQLHLGCFV